MYNLSQMTVKEKMAGKIYYGFPFYLILIFLLFDYGRPQSFLPAIGAIHPGLIIQVLLLVLLLKKGEILNLKNKQSRFFLALIFLMAIHVPIDTNNYWAYIIWKGTTLYFIVYLSIVRYVDSFYKVEKYFNVWLAINLAGAIIGIINGGKIPHSGFMGDENDFALVMNMAIPFAYFLFLSSSSVKKKFYYLFAIIIFLAGDIASLSRGGFVGVVAVILYCWYKSPKKMGSAFVILFLIASFYFSVDLLAPKRSGKHSTYWEEIKSIKEENVSTGTGGGRWYAWKIGWLMFLDNPIIGVGPNNFPWNVGKYQPQEDLTERAGIAGRAAHSTYISLISELGLVGCLLFGGMLFYSIKDLKAISQLANKYQTTRNKHGTNTIENSSYEQLQKLNLFSLAIKGSLIGYFTSGAFLSTLYYPHFWLMIGLVVATWQSSSKIVSNFQS